MALPDPQLAADLLRQARQLKTQLSAFGRTARKVHRRLDPAVPDEEVEVMRTPAANLLGTLECLIGDDLKPVGKKLSGSAMTRLLSMFAYAKSGLDRNSAILFLA